VSGPLPVHIVNSAARAITEAAEWWAANRDKAPNAFVEELAQTLQLIASQPGIGARATPGLAAFDKYTSLAFIIMFTIGSQLAAQR